MKEPHFMSYGVARAAVVLILFALGCGGSSKPNPTSSIPQTIAFESSRALDGSNAANTTENIWAMNVDGSGARPLTTLTAPGVSSTDPAWSPDGTKIVFVASRGVIGLLTTNRPAIPTSNLWVMNADGTGAKALTQLTALNIELGFPAWSPDGTKVAFSSAQALDGSDAGIGALNIWVINADGTGAKPLTRLTAAYVRSPAPVWSPDGTKIAFGSDRALDGSDNMSANWIWNVWVVNADGTGAKPLTTLTAAGASSSDPAWSPDGTRIAFDGSRALDGSDAGNTNFASNLWVMNADGTDAKPLTHLTALNAWAAGPVWSPDGMQVAFSSDKALDDTDAALANQTNNLWLVNADGTGAIPLTRLTAAGANFSGYLSWSPDGAKIVFDSQAALDGSDATNGTPYAVGNIWIINRNGAGAMPLTKITAPGGYSGNPCWQP